MWEALKGPRSLEADKEAGADIPRHQIGLIEDTDPCRAVDGTGRAENPIVPASFH